MKPGDFFQRSWEYSALSVCAFTLAFIGDTTYVRIARITIDCTHLSVITLLQVWKREICLKLKLPPPRPNVGLEVSRRLGAGAPDSP